MRGRRRIHIRGWLLRHGDCNLLLRVDGGLQGAAEAGRRAPTLDGPEHNVYTYVYILYTHSRTLMECSAPPTGQNTPAMPSSRGRKHCYGRYADVHNSHGAIPVNMPLKVRAYGCMWGSFFWFRIAMVVPLTSPHLSTPQTNKHHPTSAPHPTNQQTSSPTSEHPTTPAFSLPPGPRRCATG